MVKSVFLALPASIQARILLMAIQHPDANDLNASSEQQAQMVKDLMASGGVVSVKLAQMIAEDPRVPKEYRQMLGDLRENNTAMSRAAFWQRLPVQLRAEIKQLGEPLGTGSVKQVQKVRFRPDSQISHQECAVAVLRKHVEDEAMASLAALQATPDLAPIAKKLGRLVYGEFNLFEEGEALEEFALTSIGRHKNFKVVKVHHHSPKCLVEEIAHGPTVAKVLEGVTAETAMTPVDPSLQETLDLLTDYHHAVFDAFVHDGIIHSDIHLGNAVQGKLSGTDRTGFTLYDVGQFERIGPADTKAILWTLSWVTTSLEGGLNVRNVALSSLASASTLEDHPALSEKETKLILEARISAAFEQAISPDPETGELPDKKTAYMLLLRDAEAKQVALPKGAFAVAKMIDGIISQQASYGLPQVLDEAITSFLKSNMTWAETLSLTHSALTGYGSSKPSSNSSSTLDKKTDTA
eukprot:TRINITY_DN5953_c0_g1_i1.p1 TRINITY_DN5953_c0_g1~~TRINITY_DN5953_c0_g1_i1.p1  ORF type:complete len:467 (+),score=102.24 TRINITY_DN5953_c0_g1_i1:1277-2677(+)